MGVQVSIAFYGDEKCRANVLGVAGGQRFIVVHLGADTSLTLDGYDDTAVDQARTIAAVFLEAANELERQRAADRAADPEPMPAPPIEPDPPDLGEITGAIERVQTRAPATAQAGEEFL